MKTGHTLPKNSTSKPRFAFNQPTSNEFTDFRNILHSNINNVIFPQTSSPTPTHPVILQLSTTGMTRI